jgi:DNA-binding CsgD family transcriptional regulator
LHLTDFPDFSHYQVPLAVLRGVLGPATPPAKEPPLAVGLSRRSWRCGCSAQFRDTAHQTAAWRPCEAHRSNLQAQPAINGTTLTPDVLGRRLGPTFCIVDLGFNVLCKSPGVDVEDLLKAVRGHVELAISQGDTVVIPSGENTLLRIVPLRGAVSGTFAIIVERLRARGSLTAAAQHFGLTRRETDVLRSLVANRTNAEIARELCIAESTVSDHIKALFRKAGANKRTELLTKLFLI